MLQGLSNGEHLLDIDMKPDLQYHYRISSNGTNVQKNLRDNATIAFHVFGNFDAPVPTDQSSDSEPFSTALVITASGASAAIIGVSLLVYFKRRKHK
jgi:hypothetical protein